jgi:hypothetical protein
MVGSSAWPEEADALLDALEAEVAAELTEQRDLARDTAVALEQEGARLQAERDEFCNRVDTLTAVAKGNKQHVASMYGDLQETLRERNEARARVAELGARDTPTWRQRAETAEARVAELETERKRYVGAEPTIAEEMAHLNRCIDAVLDLCDIATRAGITSGGPFTVDSVRNAAEGLGTRTTYPPAMPWAALMDTEDLQDFLGDLIDTLNSDQPTTRDVLAEVEKTCASHRAIAEAQHAHNTADGPNAEAGEGQ